jgi:hypothetical protein
VAWDAASLCRAVDPILGVCPVHLPFQDGSRQLLTGPAGRRRYWEDWATTGVLALIAFGEPS